MSLKIELFLSLSKEYFRTQNESKAHICHKEHNSLHHHCE